MNQRRFLGQAIEMASPASRASQMGNKVTRLGQPPTPSPYPSGPREPFPIQVPMPWEKLPQRTFQTAQMPGEPGTTPPAPPSMWELPAMPGFTDTLPGGMTVDVQMRGKVTTLGQWDTLERYIAEFKTWCERRAHYLDVWEESVDRLVESWESEISGEDRERLRAEAYQDRDRYRMAERKVDELAANLEAAGCDVSFVECDVECPPEPKAAPQPAVPVPTPSPYPSGPREPFPVQVPMPWERSPQRTFQTAPMPGEPGGSMWELPEQRGRAPVGRPSEAPRFGPAKRPFGYPAVGPQIPGPLTHSFALEGGSRKGNKVTLGQQELLTPELGTRFVQAVDVVLRAYADGSPEICVRAIVPNDDWLFGLAQVRDNIERWLIAPALTESDTGWEEYQLIQDTIACADKIAATAQKVPPDQAELARKDEDFPTAAVLVGGIAGLGVLLFALSG